MFKILVMSFVLGGGGLGSGSGTSVVELTPTYSEDICKDVAKSLSTHGQVVMDGNNKTSAYKVIAKCFSIEKE